MIEPINILVVDDDPTLLEVIEAFLQNNGHRVVACENGVDALAELMQQPL